MTDRYTAEPEDAEACNRSLAIRALAELGLTDIEPKIHILERYVSLLMRWNRRMNLTAIRDETSIWSLHLLDCLAVLPLLRERLQPLMSRNMGSNDGETISVLDAGTGAGLPAMPLSLGEPSWKIFAVDAVDKKVSFVRQAAAQLGLGGLIPIHARLEQLSLDAEDQPALPRRGFDLIVSRAYASLRDFVCHTHHLLHPEGIFCAMKGREPRAEIEALKADFPAWSYEVVSLRVPGLDAQRCAVIMQRRKDRSV